jgi:hypothetical protein
MRRSFPVVMLGNIAVIRRAASHGMTHPGSASQWGIEKHNRQQAQACGGNAAAIFGRFAHESSQ